MGTLWSELAPISDDRAEAPRVYADANVPAGLVAYMRNALAWDVLFVVEHDDLRRAPDREHYRLARQLRRTLITMDRDYLDDRGFPPAETAGLVILSAPDQRGLESLLDRLNDDVFYDGDGALIALPLAGTKRQVFPELGARR
jgi:hypothetical protein